MYDNCRLTSDRESSNVRKAPAADCGKENSSKEAFDASVVGESGGLLKLIATRMSAAKALVSIAVEYQPSSRYLRQVGTNESE